MKNMSTDAVLFALLGRPNVGKSSIINTLLKEKVAAVSSKLRLPGMRFAVYCLRRSEQIVFVDTPGIHKPKHVLGDFMVKRPANKTLSQWMLSACSGSG